MGSQFRVLHPVPKPISVLEFKDVLNTICRPRFPAACYARSRRPALAISGGVDSMALAFLFSGFYKTFRDPVLADNRMLQPWAVIVDHAMRAGSLEEAEQTSLRIHKLGLRSDIRTIKWGTRKERLNPNLLPNIESLARARRYENLAVACYMHSSTSLFLAHHQDDQYETLLMRLLSGHGYRGLQGIQPANDIPECHGMYGVSKSGLLADIASADPYLRFSPTGSGIKSLRGLLRRERNPNEPRGRLPLEFPGQVPRTVDPGVPPLSPLHSEDGGVMVYRPLLEFSKDRLIATCEANKVEWSEDRTNKDRTLTMRNAVRHMVANHKLPTALQKPAILALSQKASRRLQLEEAEARRLLEREAVIKDFDPNAGTLLVEMPTFKPSKRKRNSIYSVAREEARRPQQQTVAALVVRKLLEFVTPEPNLPSVGNLENAVRQLFPELNDTRPALPPVAFSIASVLFDPVVRPGSTVWLLSRAPYHSKNPTPVITPSWPGMGAKRLQLEELARYAGASVAFWRRLHGPELWDGRYWVRLRSSLKEQGTFIIKPYAAEHARAFRRALGPRQRARLEAILKHYAPGKVRYTLPAIYAVEKGGELSSLTGPGNQEPPDGGESGASDKTSKETLLALPTFRVQLPHLERWLQYNVSYKKVDLSLLGLRKRSTRTSLVGYGRPACSASRHRRRVRQILYARRRKEAVSGGT